VLLGKGKMELQSMIHRLIETGRCCGMEMNAEKTKVTSITRQQSPVQIWKIKNNWRM
jgi:hypothetical protein